MVFSLLKKLFKESPPAKEKKPTEKHFKFFICDDDDEIPLDRWYRLKRWRTPNFLKMESDWTQDWKIFSMQEKVAGVTINNRMDYFLIMGDQEDFKVFLERERDNPVDPNAIKVMGSATVEGEPLTGQLGYLSKETAELLKDEEELDARPRTVNLPSEDRYYGLSVTVLVRSKSHKKKMKKA
jgi:hypothetical protein